VFAIVFIDVDVLQVKRAIWFFIDMDALRAKKYSRLGCFTDVDALRAKDIFGYVVFY